MNAVDRGHPSDAQRLVVVAVGCAVILAVGMIGDLLSSTGSVEGLFGIVAVFFAVFARQVWFVVVVGSTALVLAGAACVTKRVVGGSGSDGLVELNFIAICAAVILTTVLAAIIVRRGQALRSVSERLAATMADIDRQDQLVRIAAEFGHIGGWSADLVTRVVVWSDEVARIHGHPAGHSPTIEEAIGYYSPDDIPLVEAAVARCASDGTPFHLKARLIRVDGTQAHVVLIGAAVRDSTGAVIAMQGAFQDVTEARLAQEVAVAEQHRFLMISESVPAILWAADAGAQIDYFNPVFYSYTGRDPESVVDGKWLSVIHPDDRDTVTLAWQRSSADHERFEAEFRVLSATGEYRWHAGRTKAERGPDGNVVRWWGSALDIHDAQLSAEQAERLAAERDAILEIVDDAVFTLDHEWRFTYVNSNAEEALHATRQVLLGAIIWEALPNLVGTPLEAVYRRAVATGQPERVSEECAPFVGWYELDAYPSDDGLTVFFRDITEARALTDRLDRARRLESVGQLTGGIAHDFNNLLTVVIGGVEVISDDPGISPDSREVIELVSLAVGRGAELTHNLLAFARNQPLTPQAVNVNELIVTLAALLDRTLGESIIVETDLLPDLQCAQVDGAQLENAIVNLCINSRDAMPAGGRLEIRTELASLDETYATRHVEVTPGDYVLVAVSDTGTGIDEDTLVRVFEPFFTTKESGKGSGMGLSMVYGFVKQSHGHVTVYSEVGLGTTVRIYLPLAVEGSDATDDDSQAPVSLPAGHEHVLLVEDDVLVQQFAATQLRGLGYVVTIASSGPEALDVLDRLERVDLLFTDVIMPGGMSGRDLADAVLERRPGTSVLFTSGYTEDVILHHGRLDSGLLLLSKPYSRKQLSEFIRRAISDGMDSV